MGICTGKFAPEGDFHSPVNTENYFLIFSDCRKTDRKKMSDLLGSADIKDIR